MTTITPTPTNAYAADARTMAPSDLTTFYDAVETFDADARELTRHYLSAYALACGYQESAEVGDVRVTLWAEGGCYHVRAHDHAPGADHGVSHIAGRLYWHTFDGPTASDARYAHPAVKVERHVARMTGAAWWIVTEDGSQVGPFFDDADDAADLAALTTARRVLRATVDALDAGETITPVRAED